MRAGRIVTVAKPLYGLTPVSRVRIPPLRHYLRYLAPARRDTYTESRGIPFQGHPAKEQWYGEQWRNIAGYDGVYQISDLGQVRNTQTSKILQPSGSRTGDSTSPCLVALPAKMHPSWFGRVCVSRLLPAPTRGDHKNGDYTDNTAANLEYVTRRENQKRFVLRSGGYRSTSRRGPDGTWYALPVRRLSATSCELDVVLVNGREERHRKVPTT